jgi:hypothetical protein
MGALPSTLQKRHGSWFAFVRGEGDLDADEAAAVGSAGAFLDALEVTELTKSYKLVTLRVLLDADALGRGLTVREIAVGAWAILRRSPDLLRDVPDDHRLPDAPDEAALRRWTAYWRANPIQAWIGEKKAQKSWFRLDGEDRLRLTLTVDGAWAGTLTRLVDELVDYRLAQYRRRSAPSDGFVCRVTWNQRDPILKLPRAGPTPVPDGETTVRLRNGSVWSFRFAQEFCNVARPVGAPSNELPDLLRAWFGPRAGQPGTGFQVRFSASPDGLWVEPERGEVAPLAPLRGVIAYPDLRAAAGHATDGAEPPDAARVWLPIPEGSSDRFAVRVAGTSMDGGKAPLRDGDWAVFRLARGAAASSVENRVVLVQVPTAGGSAFQVKRLAREGAGWRLRSDNPSGPTFPVTDDTVVIAALVQAVPPEQLGPPVGAVLAADELADAFGLDELPPRTGRRNGHRFVFVDAPGQLVAPDGLRVPAPQRPGETVYALAAADRGYRYLGVGRWDDEAGCWRIPEVDFATWRAWGTGRAVSRSLPSGVLTQAQSLVDALLSLPEADRRLERGEARTARILGPAPRGGLQLDVEGGIQRTVSLTDLAWVLVAHDQVEATGGVLDEARVNRLRYLEGTPRASTRWIDTGWALAARARGAPHVPLRRQGQ